MRNYLGEKIRGSILGIQKRWQSIDVKDIHSWQLLTGSIWGSAVIWLTIVLVSFKFFTNENTQVGILLYYGKAVWTWAIFDFSWQLNGKIQNNASDNTYLFWT